MKGTIIRIECNRDVFKGHFIFVLSVAVSQELFDIAPLGPEVLVSQTMPGDRVEFIADPFSPDALSAEELAEIQQACAAELGRRMVEGS